MKTNGSSALVASSVLYYSVHLLPVRFASLRHLERVANGATSFLPSLSNIAPSEKGSRLAPLKRDLLNIRANPLFACGRYLSSFALLEGYGRCTARVEAGIQLRIRIRTYGEHAMGCG